MNQPHFIRKIVPIQQRQYVGQTYQTQYVPQMPQQVQKMVLRQHEDSRAVKQTGANYLPSVVNEAYHNVLEQALSAIAFGKGFDEIEEGALETLCLIFHTVLKKIGEQSRMACEVAGRTVVTPGDVWFGLINMGISVSDLPNYFYHNRNQGLTIHPPTITPPENKPQALHVGIPRPHPPYVYEWMPPLPDPHTYIRTDIINEPDMSYEKVREAMSQKKRNSVASLINYMIRSYPSKCLFANFQRVIHKQVYNMVEKESKEKRMEEAFVSFRDLLGTSDIDQASGISKLLYDKGLITKQELDSGIELACMCSDGTILDTNAQIVRLADNAVIDLEEKDKVGTTRSRVHCLEAGSESLRFDWNIDDMLDSMIAMDSCSMDISNSKRDNLDEMKILQDKVTYEYIPEWCHVLIPSYEHRSYLNFPLNELKTEEEAKKESKSEEKTASADESYNGEAVKGEDEEFNALPDNPYFRPPITDLDDGMGE